MQIFIKTLIKGRILTLDLNHNTTIEEVKNKLFDIEGIPVKLQRLYYGNIILNNYRYLSDYNIMKEATLEIRINPFNKNI